MLYKLSCKFSKNWRFTLISKAKYDFFAWLPTDFMHAWILELEGKIRKLIPKGRSACNNICLEINLWISRCH